MKGVTKVSDVWWNLMKTLGTITMYYPFIDNDSKSVIDNILTDSQSYYDFVNRLCDCVSETGNSLTLSYLAAVHAWRLSVGSALDKLFQKYSDIPMIRAWTASLGKMPFEEMSLEFENIIQSIEDDWILAEIQILRTEYGKHIAPYIDTQKEIEEARLHLEQPNLECFTSSFHTLLCNWNLLHGKIDLAKEHYKKTMTIARKYDDQYQIFALKSSYTSWSRTYDAQEALILQEEAYQIARSFEAPRIIAQSKSDIGRICESLGEYDLAIQAYHESIDAYGMELGDSPAFCLSRVYCELGDGKNGLDWIETAFELAGPVAFDTPYMISQRAEALVLLGRFEEALEYLDLCHKVSLKSGRRGHIATSGLANGYYEIANDDPLTAIQTMEPCLDILIEMPVSIYINRMLLALARAEIAANANQLAEMSDKWISRLEQYAREKNLPGILMQHALLKADFLIMQGLTESAVTTLEEALIAGESPSLRTLNERIRTRLSELGRK